MLKQRASVGLFSACMLVLLSCVLLLAACGTTQYKLSLTASEGGTVTGAGTYNEGTVVTIKANPNDNYHFVGWYLNADHSGEPLSTNTSYTVTMDAEKAYYALFAENEKVTVTLTAVGEGTVVGTGDYYAGETITITATPNTDSHFLGWYTNPECTGTPLSTSASLEITVQDNITYYALFNSNTVMVNAPVTTGGSVTGAGEYDTGAQVTLTATASDLYAFLGWYKDADFAEPYFTGDDASMNTQSTITITANDTTTIYPRFETSAINFLNRIIDGAYYKYSSWTANDELSAYNMTGSVDFALQLDNINIDVTLNASMALDLDGTDSRFMLELLNNTDDSTLLGMYYIDGANNAKLYFDLNGTKYTYNFLSLAQYIGELSVSQPSSTPWTLQSIISSLTGDESISGILSMFLGYDANGLWFGGFNVEGNEIAFDIYVQRLLQDLSPFLGAIVDQNISEIITNIANTMPALNINIAANFSDQDGHKVLESASLNIVTDGEFPINVDEISITLPQFNATLGVNNLNAGFASELANVAIDTERFPATAINLLNLSVGADLNFYSGEASDTLAHAYRLELNTDINPFAILPAIKTDEGGAVTFDVNAIEWEKLGFLSLRIYDPTGVENDYLNILYDSSISTQLNVYANFINPIEIWNTTQPDPEYSFSFNTSFEISAFVDWIQNFVKNIQTLTQNSSTQSMVSAVRMAPALLNEESSTESSAQTDINVIISALISLINGENFNKVFVETVKSIVPDYTIAGTSLNYDVAKGITFDVTSLDLSLSIDIIKWEIDLGKTLFGNATQVALKFDSIQYGTIGTRDGQGNMLNPSSNNSFKTELIADSSEKWTDEGSQVVSNVKNCSSLEDITATEANLEETINSKILNFNTFSGMYGADVVMIDGTTRSVTMGVLDANIDNIDSENNTATVTFTLTNLDQSVIGSDYFNFRYFMTMAVLMGIPDLSIPYGLYTYTTTVTLTA